MDDLTGGAQVRAQQLRIVELESELSAEWLKRQLVLVMEAWDSDSILLAIYLDSRVDF